MIVRAVGVLVSALAVITEWAAVAWAEAPTPFQFEPVSQMRFVAEDGFEQAYFQPLSISPDGKFVALAQVNGRVDIWSIGGTKTAALRLAGGENRKSHVVLLGDPCVAVTGVTARLDGAGRSVRFPLDVWDCESGKHLAAVRQPVGAPDTSPDSLVALPECGLVVAAYSDRVDVIDVAAGALVRDLGELFEGARAASIASYPATVRARRPIAVRLSLAASTADNGCLVYGVAHDHDARRKALLPARLYEFDLRAKHARLVRALSYDLHFEDQGTPLTGFAVSPTQRYGAIFVRVAADVWGTSGLLVVDLKGTAPEKYFELRRTFPAVTDLAFLSDGELLLTTMWIVANTDAMLFQPASDRLHTLCHTVFGVPDIEKGNPRALAVNAKLKLVAVTLHDEVRVFRYRRNPNAKWAVKDCVED